MSGEAPDQPKDLSQAEIDAAMNQAASDAPTAGVPKDDATSKPAAASDASSKQSDDSSQPEVIAADDASADASTADDTPTAEPLKLDATGRPFDDIAVGAAVAAGSAPLPPPLRTGATCRTVPGRPTNTLSLRQGSPRGGC